MGRGLRRSYDYSVVEATSQSFLFSIISKPFRFIFELLLCIGSRCRTFASPLFRSVSRSVGVKRVSKALLATQQNLTKFARFFIDLHSPIAKTGWRVFWRLLRAIHRMLYSLAKSIKLVGSRTVVPLARFKLIEPNLRFVLRTIASVGARLTRFLSPVYQGAVGFVFRLARGAWCVVMKMAQNVFLPLCKGFKGSIIVPIARNVVGPAIRWGFCTVQSLGRVVQNLYLLLSMRTSLGDRLVRAHRRILGACGRLANVMIGGADWLNLKYANFRKKFRVGLTQNEYTLNVPQGKLVSRRKVTVAVMEDGQIYSIHLRNDNSWHVNCYLSVDGQSMGTFRLNPYSLYAIDRPLARHNRFCFVQENTALQHGEQDQSTGIVSGGKMNGMIEAKFVPCFPEPVPLKKQEPQGDPVTANVQVRLQLWDTAGQERFHSLGPMFYRAAAAILVFYDITKDLEVQRFLKDARAQNAEALLFLVGNKTDLETERKVSRSEGETFAKENGMRFFEISAKDGTMVDELFHTVAKVAPKEVTESDGLTCTVKVCLTGPASAGKTATHDRFLRRRFSSSSNCTIGASFGTANVLVADATVTRITRRRSAMGKQADESCAGATTFKGKSSQTFNYAPKLSEDPSQATTLQLILLLRKQYQHQCQLEEMLLRDLRYPKSASNIIGEYVYTRSILDAY